MSTSTLTQYRLMDSLNRERGLEVPRVRIRNHAEGEWARLRKERRIFIRTWLHLPFHGEKAEKRHISEKSSGRLYPLSIIDEARRIVLTTKSFADGAPLSKRCIRTSE